LKCWSTVHSLFQLSFRSAIESVCFSISFDMEKIHENEAKRSHGFSLFQSADEESETI
jgi:hypothetical protein